MKRGLMILAFVVFVLFSVVLVSAQNETEHLENAYQCVKDNVGVDCSSLTY